MNIGIIIIFNNNEEQINKSSLINQINFSETIEFCLVDNDSRDKTLSLLQEIKETSTNNVAIVEIKKSVSENAAKRAGARYMFNRFSLKHIGFINVNRISQKSDYDLNKLIEEVLTNQEALVYFNLKEIEKQTVKQTLFKSIFSIGEYIKKINNNRNLSVDNA